MKTTKLSIAIVFTVLLIPAVSNAQGLFGMGPATGNRPVLSTYVPTVTPTVPAHLPRNTSHTSGGTLTIAAEFSIRGEHRRDYERNISQRNNYIREVNQHVDQLNQAYRQNRNPRTEGALLQALNHLRDAKAELANFKRIWNQPVTAQFNSNSMEHKDQLLERAFRLGMQGKSLTFGNNRDGSMKVTLFHGKPNYSRSEDVTHLFR